MKTAVISPSLTISYEEAGQGTPLVLLHAFPLSSAMWEAQREAFARDFRVLTPNLRGVGETSPFESEPTIRQMADDVALWLDTLGIKEQIVLGGLSMGGYTALEFARNYADRLKGLLLLDTRADPDSAEAKKGREEMIAFAQGASGEAVGEKMLPKLLGESTRHGNPQIAAQVKTIAAANSGKTLALLAAALRDRRDSTPILADITVPTLVLGGREDAITTPEIMGAMAAKLPDAKHVVLEGAGHLSNLEQPQAFNDALRDFLADLK